MMSLLRLVFLSFLLALSAGGPAAAEILRQVPERLDPTKGYILVEIRNHDALSAPGTIVLARYDPVGNDVRGGTRSPGSTLGRGVPVRTMIGGRPIARTDESRLYFVALEPDTWVIEGAGGTAFSLESRTFAIAAGEILDLGVLSPRTDWREGEGPERMTVGRVASMALFGAFARRQEARPAMLEMRARGAEDFAVPERIRATISPAHFSDGARFGNYLGSLVNRIDGRRGRPGSEPETLAPPTESAEQP